MQVRRALDFSIFPSLLLIATLFRLALNVSSTRLVLLHGDAGKVIESFGHFVVGGSVVVGLVIFLILSVIQFIVITNGAGRVAEVGARFTLDAMPGKQMAIDADLNSGLISEDEARTRRREVAAEADFYGAMDGARKFVKGDAIAGLLITVINLFGGFVIGVVQHHLSISEAITRYSLLSVGDGLVSQIPALLISIASGLVVTRAATDADMGTDLLAQLGRQEPAAADRRQPASPSWPSCPGLPKVPFLAVGGRLWFASGRVKPTNAAERRRRLGGRCGSAARRRRPAPDTPEELAVRACGSNPSSWRSASGSWTWPTPPGAATSSTGSGPCAARWPWSSASSSRPVRTRDNLDLPPSAYAIRVHGVEVGPGRGARAVRCSCWASGPAGCRARRPATRSSASTPRGCRPSSAPGRAGRRHRRRPGFGRHGPHGRGRAGQRRPAPQPPGRQDAGRRRPGHRPGGGRRVRRRRPVAWPRCSGCCRACSRRACPSATSCASSRCSPSGPGVTKDPEVLTEAVRVALGPSISAGHAPGREAAGPDPRPDAGARPAGVAPARRGRQLPGPRPRDRRTPAGRGRPGVATAAEQQGRQPVLVCAAPIRPALRRLVRNVNPGSPSSPTWRSAGSSSSRAWEW